MQPWQLVYVHGYCHMLELTECECDNNYNCNYNYSGNYSITHLSIQCQNVTTS